jgi:hypothetical protein
MRFSFSVLIAESTGEVWLWDGLADMLSSTT